MALDAHLPSVDRKRYVALHADHAAHLPIDQHVHPALEGAIAAVGRHTCGRDTAGRRRDRRHGSALVTTGPACTTTVPSACGSMVDPAPTGSVFWSPTPR